MLYAYPKLLRSVLLLKVWRKAQNIGIRRKTVYKIDLWHHQNCFYSALLWRHWPSFLNKYKCFVEGSAVRVNVKRMVKTRGQFLVRFSFSEIHRDRALSNVAVRPMMNEWMKHLFLFSKTIIMRNVLEW